MKIDISLYQFPHVHLSPIEGLTLILHEVHYDHTNTHELNFFIHYDLLPLTSDHSQQSASKCTVVLNGDGGVRLCLFIRALGEVNIVDNGDL